MAVRDGGPAPIKVTKVTWKQHLVAGMLVLLTAATMSFGLVAGYHQYYNRPMYEVVVEGVVMLNSKADDLDTRVDSLENGLAYMTRSAQMSDLLLAQFLESLAKHTQAQDIRLDTYEKRYLDLLRAMPFYHKEPTIVDPEVAREAKDQVEQVLELNSN